MNDRPDQAPHWLQVIGWSVLYIGISIAAGVLGAVVILMAVGAA